MQILTDENGYISSYALVGNLVDGIEVPDPDDLEHFVEHYASYGFSDGKITFSDVWEAVLNKAQQIADIRRRRETECYSVINRGLLWYETLSVKQKLELTKWYQSWLDAPNTLTIPEKPEWLDE